MSGRIKISTSLAPYQKPPTDSQPRFSSYHLHKVQVYLLALSIWLHFFLIIIVSFLSLLGCYVYISGWFHFEPCPWLCFSAVLEIGVQCLSFFFFLLKIFNLVVWEWELGWWVHGLLRKFDDSFWVLCFLEYSVLFLW